MKKSLESAVDIFCLLSSFRLFFFFFCVASLLFFPIFVSSLIWHTCSCGHPLSINTFSFSCLSNLFLSLPPALLSFPVPTSLQLPFVPVCQKSASITGCCCITVAIMQIYLLFNVSKNAFFVRVRTNLHGVTRTRKGRHTSRYIFNSLTIFA